MIKTFCDICGEQTDTLSATDPEAVFKQPVATVNIPVVEVCDTCHNVRARIDVNDLLRKEILRRRVEEKTE